jgi:hypothetical protein
VALAIVGTIGGLVLWQRDQSLAEPLTNPADVGPVQTGLRAFLDRDGGTLHVDGASVELATAPGLAETGLASPVGVVYQTPDQEVRVIDATGHDTLLAAALGQPTAGFTPSVAYDAESDVVVALRMTSGSRKRLEIAAYAASGGTQIASTRIRGLAGAGMSWTLAGATDGVAVLSVPGAGPSGTAGGPHLFVWTWTIPDKVQLVTEWQRGRAFDLAHRVVLLDTGAEQINDPRGYTGGWTFLEGHQGERLDPTGAWRVDETWQPWPTDGPVERSTSDADDVALPDLPVGSRLSLSYDTDGSVMAAVASGAGDDGITTVFDCNRNADACEPIGQLDGATEDSVFLAGTTP